MMHLSKFNTLENKLIKLKSRFVLLDKDEELELMVSQNATPSKKTIWWFKSLGFHRKRSIYGSNNFKK